MEPLDFARLLLNPDRLAVLGTVAHQRHSAEEIAARTGMSERAVLQVLAAALQQGVVDVVDGRYGLDEQALHRIAVELPGEPPAAEHIGHGMTVEEQEVLARFFRGDRLVELPAQRSKRLVVLHRLALEFEPGERYPEADVNARLAAFHEDVAALRRALVEEGFLDRAHGRYWRTGGRVDTSDDRADT